MPYACITVYWKLPLSVSVNASSIQRRKATEGEYLPLETSEAEVSTYKMEFFINVHYLCLGLQVNSLHKEYLRNKVTRM